MIDIFLTKDSVPLPIASGNIVPAEVDNGVNLLLEFDGDNIVGFSSVIVGNARTADKRYSDGSRLGIGSSLVCSSSVLFWRRR